MVWTFVLWEVAIMMIAAILHAVGVLSWDWQLANQWQVYNAAYMKWPKFTGTDGRLVDARCCWEGLLYKLPAGL